MKIKSFDDNSTTTKIKRDPNQDNLFDLFQKNIVNSLNIPLKIYIVPKEFEMRLDRISEYLYGSTDYIEELMTLNDLVSPYSIKEGQYIYHCTLNNMGMLYKKDEISVTQEESRAKLINSSQPNRDKKVLSKEKNLPPTIKPSTLQQVKVTNDNKVKIINSFE